MIQSKMIRWKIVINTLVYTCQKVKNRSNVYIVEITVKFASATNKPFGSFKLTASCRHGRLLQIRVEYKLQGERLLDIWRHMPC